MRRLFALLLGGALGGGVVFAAYQYHLVRTADRFLLVGKQEANWRDAYVDIRAWTPREWGDHPALARNLIAAGHGQLVQRSITSSLWDDLFRAVRGKRTSNRMPAEHSYTP